MTTQRWYAKQAGNDCQGLVIDEDTGRTVAVAYDRQDTELLAAAPELLEALRNMLKDAGNQDRCWPHDLARAAIARAEGGAK